MALEETPQTLLLLGPNICFLKSLVAIMKMPVDLTENVWNLQFRNKFSLARALAPLDPKLRKNSQTTEGPPTLQPNDGTKSVVFVAACLKKCPFFPQHLFFLFYGLT